MILCRNWARWLAMAWIALHVVLGALHSTQQLLVHIVVFAVFAFVLFRRPGSEYFRRT